MDCGRTHIAAAIGTLSQVPPPAELTAPAREAAKPWR